MTGGHVAAGITGVQKQTFVEAPASGDICKLGCGHAVTLEQRGVGFLGHGEHGGQVLDHFLQCDDAVAVGVEQLERGSAGGQNW